MKSIRGISATSRSIGFYRSGYASKIHTDTDIKAVDRVSGIKPMSWESDDHNVEHEQVEAAYQKIRNVDKEYKAFFISEHEFEETLSHVHVEDDDFIGELVEFLKICNRTLDALREFDIHFGTAYHREIEDIVDAHRYDLGEAAIVVEPDTRLSFVKERIAERYMNSPESFDFIAREHGMAQRLLESFRMVKNVVLGRREDVSPKDEIHGLMIDFKI